ncbi:MAG: MarC family protein [Ferrimonas sp.]
MSESLSHTLAVFFAFFAMMNPLASTMVFVGLTRSYDLSQKRAIACKSMIVTFIIIAIFSLLGKVIFHFFGITLPALRIAGGVIVAIVGYDMLKGNQSDLHHSDAEDARSVAISPLAVPMMAGPGTIATAMSYSANEGFFEPITTVVAFGVLCVITYGCFRFAQPLIHFLGNSLIEVITRLMGLILAVIGVQMLLLGIDGAVKSYSYFT